MTNPQNLVTLSVLDHCQNHMNSVIIVFTEVPIGPYNDSQSPTFSAHFFLKLSSCLHSGIPHAGAHPGGVGAGLHLPPPNLKFKNTDFVDMMMSKGLRDLPFSRNRLMTSTLKF